MKIFIFAVFCPGGKFNLISTYSNLLVSKTSNLDLLQMLNTILVLSDLLHNHQHEGSIGFFLNLDFFLIST